jgi:hypothetical protein
MLFRKMVNRALIVVAFSSSSVALAGEINVNTLNNVDQSGGGCSLIEAIIAVNGSGRYRECNAGPVPGPHTVKLPQGTMFSGAIVPNKAVTIVGTGLATSAISFNVNTGSGCGIVAFKNNLTLRNLTISQTSPPFLSGICGVQDATMAAFDVLLEGVRVQSFQNGGVRLFAGTLSGKNVLVQNNSTPGSGAGIAIFEDASLSTIENLALINNVAGGVGGGLYRDTNGLGNIVNGTISGNRAPLGGGIYTSNATAYLELRHVTIAANSASNSGGGIYVATDGNGTPLKVINSVIVGNTATFGGANFCDSGGLPNAAHSFNSVWGGPFDEFTNDINFNMAPNRTIQQATVSSEFSALLNPGAPFFLPVYSLKATSAAVSFAPCGVVPTDQRGVSRPQGPGCDSGAFER